MGLVLSRHLNETIMIGDDIKVTVTDVRGNKMRLQIDAPRDMAVHRAEVYMAIQRDRAIERNTEAWRADRMALGLPVTATDGDLSHGVMDEATNANDSDRIAGTDAATEGTEHE